MKASWCRCSMVLSNEIKKELLQRYALNEISAVDLWCSLPLDVRRDRSFAQVFVDTSIQHRNPLDLEFALALFATPELGANFDICPDMLCSLLDMDWQTNRLSYKLTKVLCC